MHSAGSARSRHGRSGGVSRIPRRQRVGCDRGNRVVPPAQSPTGAVVPRRALTAGAVRLAISADSIALSTKTFFRFSTPAKIPAVIPASALVPGFCAGGCYLRRCRKPRRSSLARALWKPSVSANWRRGVTGQQQCVKTLHRRSDSGALRCMIHSGTAGRLVSQTGTTAASAVVLSAPQW